MRISDWSSDVCSSDLGDPCGLGCHGVLERRRQPSTSSCPSGPPLISLVSEPDPDLLTPIFYNATRYMTQSVIARSERRSLPSPVHTSRRSGDRKRKRLNSSHKCDSRMQASA